MYCRLTKGKTRLACSYIVCEYLSQDTDVEEYVIVSGSKGAVSYVDLSMNFRT